MTALGLKRGIVVLKKHDQKWKKIFAMEKDFLIKLLGEFIIDIQHIGSTAIPGLAAKPIIDILVGIDSLSNVVHIRPILESAGYEYRGNGSNSEQILFAKGPQELRTHYLHITEYGKKVWRDNLFFRDYLCANPGELKKYEELKQALVIKYANDRESYTAAKSEFIQSVLNKNPDNE